ncbi:hypothetical protein Ddye_026101 [Dipteronia dyeriana]|uniref:Uncharacterized protein n=1 Tax=Dipteronia dyeriana TaxID=168575 RepID=A0AAD9TLL9_9ROSI|nr:hypothetical protein Ddye_026101 [Dipteronia dyeriana]
MIRDEPPKRLVSRVPSMAPDKRFKTINYSSGSRNPENGGPMIEGGPTQLSDPGLVETGQIGLARDTVCDVGEERIGEKLGKRVEHDFVRESIEIQNSKKLRLMGVVSNQAEKPREGKLLKKETPKGKKNLSAGNRKKATVWLKKLGEQTLVEDESTKIDSKSPKNDVVPNTEEESSSAYGNDCSLNFFRAQSDNCKSETEISTSRSPPACRNQ